MKCPLQLLIKETNIVDDKAYQKVDLIDCCTVWCGWYDTKKKQCCIKSLSELNISGLVNTHPG